MKKAATSKLFSVKYCEIHKEWLIKGLMIPIETELNKWSTSKRNTFHTVRILRKFVDQKNDIYKGKRYIFHDHFMRVMAEILLAPEPNYKLKY